MCSSVQFSQIVSKSVCSVNNRGDIFGTTYVIGLHAVRVHSTLIKGGGGQGECYIISGGGSVVLLDDVIWGVGCQKWTFFVITARCTLVQSAVLRSHVVCLSVCLSVCL